MDSNYEPATIDVDALAKRIDAQDVFVVDVRSTDHGDQIFGSIRYKPKRLEDASHLVLPLPKGSGLIVLYDEDGSSKRVFQIARKLAAEGYGEIRTLAGGFAAWKSADGKMQERSMEQPIPGVTEHQTSR